MNFKLNIKHINKIQNLLVTWAHFKYYKKKILKKTDAKTTHLC